MKSNLIAFRRERMGIMKSSLFIDNITKCGATHTRYLDLDDVSPLAVILLIKSLGITIHFGDSKDSTVVTRKRAIALADELTNISFQIQGEDDAAIFHRTSHIIRASVSEGARTVRFGFYS